MSILATLAASGASGAAGGSLLMVPMACSLFGISNEMAGPVVSIGFIISVVQDSFETAINSSGDVLFAAAAEYCGRVKEDKIAKKLLRNNIPSLDWPNISYIPVSPEQIP